MLREKPEDSGVWCWLFRLYQDGLVLLREMVGQWACWGAILPTGLIGAGGAVHGTYAVKPCLELGVCWGAEPCVFREREGTHFRCSYQLLREFARQLVFMQADGG